MNKSERAVYMFQNGSVCSQAILSVFAEKVGLDIKTAHKIGTGLGAGFGRKQYTCGAITAAVILISLKYGNENPGETALKEKTYSLVRDFFDKLEEILGSSSCRELLGLPIQSEDELEQAKGLNVFSDICPQCIKTVAEELEKKL